MTSYVIDTNIVSAVVRRRDRDLIARMNSIVKPEDQILGCPVVWYEVRRGLLARDAKLQMRVFERLFARFTWQDYNLNDWTLATTLWAQRRAQGKPISDADLMIAVFALNRNAVLVTDNEKDFAGLGVTVENWMRDNP
jgi:predicted nucleic acid-binding protein